MSTRRTQLSRTEYVAAAVEFLGRRPLADMTMRVLGEELGVDATALYRHFASKDALLDATVDWMLGEIVERLDKSITDPRRFCIHGALTLREVFGHHPQVGLALMSGEGGQGPNGVDFVRIMVSALKDLGLKDRDLVVCYQAFEGFVLGSCVQDFLGAPHNFDIRRTRWRGLEIREFDAQAGDANDVKNIAEDAFRFGLDVLMDRCESIAATSR